MSVAEVDLTIVVIAHDVRDEVRTCLEAIEATRGELRVQVVVVDNGSSDGTADDVAARHPEVEVVRLPRNEGGSSRNHGLRRARGRHRMFLDSDARPTPGALAEIVRFLDERPDVGLVGPRLEGPDGTLQHSARRLPPRRLPLMRRPPLSRFFEGGRTVREHLMLDADHGVVREAEYVIGACQAFSRAAQEAAGELDPRIPLAPEDIDWCVMIRRRGFRIAYLPSAVVVHDYRRATARSPLSRAAFLHLYGFALFFVKRRRERRELIAQGDAMAARGWRLPGPGEPA